MKTIFGVILTLVMALLAVGAINYASLPGQLAMIDQLRLDADNIAAPSSEDVVGQITQWNQSIVFYQTYNMIPVVELMIPDFWDKVEPIPVPKSES